MPRGRLPKGELRVLPDGSWHTDGQPVRHEASLRYLKSRLVFEADAAFIEDGGRRLRISVEGPAYVVTALELHPERGEAVARLDDGSSEALSADSLAMSHRTGRIECLVRKGRARAVLSRSAHQSLLEGVVEERGEFFLVAGPRRFRIRT